MARVYNFSAGPATLPESVLAEAASEMLDYRGSGMSVMEMSHRSKEFQQIIDEAEADLRDLMGIPENYKVLFLQGGAWTQFAAIPMNLLKKGKADYILTGSWGKKACKEAGKYGDIRVAASSEDKNFTYVPDVDAIEIREDADYVYICDNETIFGTKFHKYPETKGDTVLVADVSSCFLSEPMDVSKFGLIYGGVQKNIGPAGAAIVIVREDLIRDDVPEFVPTILKYKTQADKGSMFNTPPCYTIYICGKVFKWLKAQGGLEGIQKRNQEKAAVLYDYLDTTDFYIAPVRKEDRSIMNVPFILKDDSLNEEFIAGAKEVGIVNIKGHRDVGGMRASIYNAMSKEGVEALVDYMKKFETEHK
ncbi:MAG: 3-phosphoserine/phosphohydroxythreonine transaminase [Coriobacteriia bacterium]|nr:3-phosphoserine/phosphohydroxythreonine transaminase [Coriobacteriia bacterium]